MSDIVYEKMNIQWFPGHMTKAKREMQESLKMVDAVCEIIDARIPYSSHNPDVDELIGDKPKLILLNRIDVADPELTKKWESYYREQGHSVLQISAKTGQNTDKILPAIKSLLKDKIAYYESKGQVGKVIRIMILGIPNAGKSTVINRLAKRKVSAVEDRPGVTRGRQWIKLDSNVELLDTPGILWPKFETQEVAEMLAVTNAIKADVLDKETLAANFITRLSVYYPEAVKNRYKIEREPGQNGFELLEQAARKRGFLVSGGEPDYERMANILLNEYHDGKLGRITLENPDEFI